MKSVMTKWIGTIRVIDPDTGNLVEVELRKLESGGIVGLDGSYLHDLADDEQPNNPYDDGKIIVPDDETEPLPSTNRHYVLTFSYCEPALTGPFSTPEKRDAEARRIFNGGDFTQGEDDIGWLDQTADGTLNVGAYTDEDLEEGTE
jgi:hypothetical protein